MSGRGPSPWRLLALTLAAIFIAEGFVMLVLSRFPNLPPQTAGILDGALVSAMLLPALYVFLVGPLREQIVELDTLRAVLGREREAYRSLIDSTEDSIYLVDPQCRYLFVNRHHAARLGQAADAAVGKAYADLHTPEQSSAFAAAIDAVVRGRRSSSEEYWSARDNRHFLRSFSPVAGPRGETVAVTVVSKDITDLKLLEQRLQELSITDELTGLQNRRGFDTLATHRLKVAAREGAEATLLYADLDNLKQINDRHGHPAGDRAIREAARILAESCRGSDIVARVGGDEFVVLVTGAPAGGVEKLEARIQLAIEQHNAGAPEEQRLAMSIGHAICPPGAACTVASLFAIADRAMYQAKARRKAAVAG